MTNREIKALAQFYDANIQLFHRLTILAQESGQEWSEQRKQAIAVVISDANAELSELQEASNSLHWIAQIKIVRNHWERRQQIVQELLQSASGNAVLNSQLADAFRDWYSTVTELALVDGMSHVTSPWVSYLSQFQQFWSSIPGQASSSDETFSDLD